MAKYERKIIMGTSIQTGAVRLDHYNAWLLNPKQRWITGQVIGVDGGLADLRSKA